MKRRAWIWGVFFLFAAIFVLVGRVGVIAVVGPWSILLSAFLVIIIMESCIQLNFFGILLPLAGIASIYAKPLGIESITPWPLMVSALLASIGLTILFRKQMQKQHEKRRLKERKKVWGNAPEFVEGSINQTGQTFSASSSFSGQTQFVNSQELEYADLTASFGELKVYFDQAVISPNGAVIEAHATFGTVELYIPRHWNVDVQLNKSFGDIKQHGMQAPVLDSAVVRLIGGASFGDIKIFYV